MHQPNQYLLKFKPVKTFSLFLVILSLLGQIVLAQAENMPRLIFEKKADISSEDIKTHEVQKGEWIYKILNNYGLSTSQVLSWMPLINNLNSHIKNLDALEPGQILRLPAQVIKSKKYVSQKQDGSKEALKKISQSPSYAKIKTYMVRPGETLGSILQKKLEIEDKKEFLQYIQEFKLLNPHIKNVNLLIPGQKIKIPKQKPNKYTRLKNATLSSDVNGSSHDISEINPEISGREEQPATGINSSLRQTIIRKNRKGNSNKQSAPLPNSKAMTRILLKSMGFSPIPGQELLYPVQSGRWFRINLQQTPVLQTPWGENIILFSSFKSQSWQEQAMSLGFSSCKIENWNPKSVIRSLSNAYSDRIKLWSDKHSLLLHLQNKSLELNSSFIVRLKKSSGIKFFMLNILENGSLPFSNMLKSYLHTLNIYVYEWKKQKNGYLQSISLPTIAAHNLILPFVNFKQLASILQGHKLPAISPLTLSWGKYGHAFIRLTIPARIWQQGREKIAILDQNLADGYLVSLISMQGYSCYILNDK